MTDLVNVSAEDSIVRLDLVNVSAEDALALEEPLCPRVEDNLRLVVEDAVTALVSLQRPSVQRGLPSVAMIRRHLNTVDVGALFFCLLSLDSRNLFFRSEFSALALALSASNLFFRSEISASASRV